MLVSFIQWREEIGMFYLSYLLYCLKVSNACNNFLVFLSSNFALLINFYYQMPSYPFDTRHLADHITSDFLKAVFTTFTWSILEYLVSNVYLTNLIYPILFYGFLEQLSIAKCRIINYNYLMSFKSK